MNNLERASEILSCLLGLGVSEFVLCAGARNSPFVKVLEENLQVKTWSFFEERSAAFFALGRIQKLKQPVAVITTSGTAVAELLPATIEAHYSELPLIVVSADRPVSYRNSGAPQTINQIGIFSHYTEITYDIGEQEIFPQAITWSKRAPIHFNVCIDEPLMSGQTQYIEEKNVQQFLPVTSNSLVSCPEKYSSPLIIVSGVNESYRGALVQFLGQVKCPLYLEGTSGLRGEQKLLEHSLQASEGFLFDWITKGKIKSVIRIGGVPTLRLWRDLESKLNSIPVFSFNNSNYSGLARNSEIFKIETLLELDPRGLVNHNIQELIDRDRKAASELTDLLAKYPNSELSFFNRLSDLIGAKEVYVGNSMPIRNWDLAANYDFNTRVWANRGANGIDGQLSTFLGLAESGSVQNGIFGDLTTMYDLSAPWIAQQLAVKDLNIFIINNFGGQIFNRMFSSQSFLNSHNLDFKPLAQFWGWNYQCWDQLEAVQPIKGLNFIEVRPDCTSSGHIQDDIVKLWQNL